MAKARPLRLRPLMFWLMPITRSPAQKSACKDLKRNGQNRAITLKAAYTPTSNRAGSRLLFLGGVILKGPRVTVRPFATSDSDIDDYFAYARLEQVTRAAGMAPLMTRQEAANHVKRFARERQDLALVYHLHVIGNIGIYPRELSPLTGDDMTREIGYILHPAYWHRGLMREGLQLVIANQFAHGIKAIWAGVFPSNHASIHLLKRLGFTFQFEVPLPRGLSGDHPRDEQYFRLLPNQFENEDLL